MGVMVRRYLLTEREKEIIQFYLDTGKQLDGFRELKHILHTMDLTILNGDRELISRFIESL